MKNGVNNLFICNKCCAVDSSLYISDTGVNKEFPNMKLQEMQGRTANDTTIIKDGVETVYKTKDEVKLLCSECNTGTWHGTFEKRQISPTDSRIFFALYSKFGFITPYDHPTGIYSKLSLKNEDGSDLYALNNSKYITLYREMNKYSIANGKGNIIMGEELKSNKRLRVLLDVFREDIDNIYFDEYTTDTLFKFMTAIRLEDGMNELFLFIKDKLKGSSTTFLILSAIEMFTNNLDFDIAIDVMQDAIKAISETSKRTVKDLLGSKDGYKIMAMIEMHPKLASHLKPNSKTMIDEQFKNKKKLHWKDTQSAEEKEARIGKAIAKRKRKNKEI